MKSRAAGPLTVIANLAAIGACACIIENALSIGHTPLNIGIRRIANIVYRR
jgi:hypothetical protein